MLPIYICDDNKTLLNIIKNHVHDYLIMHQVDDTYKIFAFSSSLEFLKNYKQMRGTGIYLLDCKLDNNIKGTDLAKQIRSLDPIGYIIFISAYDEYIPLTLQTQVNTLTFISKETKNFKLKLYEALDSAFKMYENYTNHNNSDEFFFVNSGSRTIPIKYKDIVSIETSHKPHRLILKTSSMQIEFYDNLDNVFKHLNSSNFIRCNRSAIININHIDHINKVTNIIVMKNNEDFFCSKRGFKNIL